MAGLAIVRCSAVGDRRLSPLRERAGLAGEKQIIRRKEREKLERRFGDSAVAAL